MACSGNGHINHVPLISKKFLAAIAAVVFMFLALMNVVALENQGLIRARNFEKLGQEACERIERRNTRLHGAFAFSSFVLSVGCSVWWVTLCMHGASREIPPKNFANDVVFQRRVYTLRTETELMRREAELAKSYGTRHVFRDKKLIVLVLFITLFLSMWLIALVLNLRIISMTKVVGCAKLPMPGKVLYGNRAGRIPQPFTHHGRSAYIGNGKAEGASQSLSDARAAIPDDVARQLAATRSGKVTHGDLAQAASDKNQVMDELLNQDQIPADYGVKMVELFRDKRQDVLTRDFAVQHIGLYAQALQRRGAYDPASAEARMLRATLDEASADTKSIIAAAAFRALADLSEFDPHVDARRLDARIAACLGDASAAPAARVMAAHLCGERRVAAARATLSALADDPATPTPLRLAARNAIEAWSAP